MDKVKAAIVADDVFFYDGDIVNYVYGKERVKHISLITDLFPVRITSKNIEKELDNLKDVEVIFSCWGMFQFTDIQLEKMPNLKAVFYAGGSVTGFASRFLDRGIIVCNAVEANAIPVAEFCLGQIILSCKGAYNNSLKCNNGPWEQSEMKVGNGVYGETIALTGIGAISRHLIKLLKSFNLRIIAVSGYLSKNPGMAKDMGIDKLVSLEEAFKEGYIISNHLADKESTKGIITEDHFSSMREGATFINTGRGAQVNEDGMIKILKSRSDLTALLDVQYPEPPLGNSELFSLPNVHMTSHIAGSSNDEVQRMADFMLEEFKRWIAGDDLLYSVNPTDLAGRA